MSTSDDFPDLPGATATFLHPANTHVCSSGTLGGKCSNRRQEFMFKQQPCGYWRLLHLATSRFKR
jgi:hypothetical protein